MSWARDEWKLDLPNAALRKISELENDAENLRKGKQQQQFQLETVSNSLQKQKQLNAEEKAANSTLRREIQELTRKCSDLENQEEKSQIDLKAKDNKIGLLEEQLRKAREKLKDEEDRNSEVLNQVDRQKLIVEVKENEIGQLTEEVERINETKVQMMKDLEAAKQKIEILFKENEAMKHQLKERDELLTSCTNSSIVDDETAPVTETDDPRTPDNVSSAFLEILKRENNSLISENEELKVQVDHLKIVQREKEKELERVMQKLAASQAECEKKAQLLKAREKEVSKLQDKLARAEAEIRNTERKVETLEEKAGQLYEEIQSEKRHSANTKEKISTMRTALLEAENKIKTLETDLSQRSNKVKAKRERIETLEEENVQLTQELDSLKRQNNASTESYLAATKVLREKDHRIEELEEDHKERKKQLRVFGEKVEVLTSENNRLVEELQQAEERFANADRSYRRVSKALDNWRKMSKEPGTGAELWDGEKSEGLEKRNRVDREEISEEQEKKDGQTSKCSNCHQMTKKLKKQEEYFSLKVRELEACTQKLTAEKEALEKERRNSEEFTMRVQQMVQEMENANKTERDDNREEQVRETGDFFNMVKRFFAENEGLKKHAQKCLSDLEQLQKYIRSCSSGVRELLCHTDEFEPVAKRISLLKSLLETVVVEFARPLKEEESDTDGNEDSPMETNFRPELSWDDYEREVAFKAFKDNVQDIIQQIDKDKEMTKKRVEEFQEVKRAHRALKRVRKRSRQAIERAVARSEIEDLCVEEPPEDTPKGSHQTNSRMERWNDGELVEVIKDLLEKNREVLAIKMDENFSILENIVKQQRVHNNLLSDERNQKIGGESVRETMDGKYAIGELDLVKRKLSDVQKIIKHLTGSLVEVEHVKKTVESKVDLLNGELSRKESQYEAKCEDLKRVTKIVSDQEVSFRNRLEQLASEKDEINSELRGIVGVLKERELELVERSQQLKHLQTTYNDMERSMKSKIDALEQENNGVWLDYKEADKRAEIKETEFKELADRLKKSQGYMHSMFSSLTNMDDELQRARDIEVFGEQD